MENDISKTVTDGIICREIEGTILGSPSTGSRYKILSISEIKGKVEIIFKEMFSVWPNQDRIVKNTFFVENGEIKRRITYGKIIPAVAESYVFDEE